MEQDGYLLLILSCHYIFRALCACHCWVFHLLCVCVCARTCAYESLCALHHSVMSDSLWPHGLYPARLLCPSNFPGKNTGVGCHFLLQGIFPTPRIEPESLSVSYGDRWILYRWATKEASCPVITSNILYSRSHYIYRSHLRKLLCRTFQQPPCRSTIPKKQRWYKIHLYTVLDLFVQFSPFLWMLRK